MEAIQSLSHPLPGMPVRNTIVAKPEQQLPALSPSLKRTLAHFARVLLGLMFLVLGSALVFTLWLMPIGLPLALLGVALIAAPSDV